VPWPVLYHSDAATELGEIPSRNERKAIYTAIGKLKELGPTLGNPHSSDVKGADRLRELRPRAGNSPWRVFYRQIGMTFVVGAVGPEADVDPTGFKRAVKLAGERLDDMKED
jgi:hypothetical protein